LLKLFQNEFPPWHCIPRDGPSRIWVLPTIKLFLKKLMRAGKPKRRAGVGVNDENRKNYKSLRALRFHGVIAVKLMTVL